MEEVNWGLEMILVGVLGIVLLLVFLFVGYSLRETDPKQYKAWVKPMLIVMGIVSVILLTVFEIIWLLHMFNMGV